MNESDIDLVTLAGLWSARLGRALHPGQVEILLSDLDSLRVWGLAGGGAQGAAEPVRFTERGLTCGRCWRVTEDLRGGWCQSCREMMGVS